MGFDPAIITVPVRTWHGDLDTVVLVSHSVWLADRVNAATLFRGPESGHAGHFDATPEVLAWLVER